MKPDATYYFDLTVNGEPLNDTIEITLADDQAAWDEVIRTSTRTIRDMEGQPATRTEWQIQVADELGPLFSIEFRVQKIGGEGLADDRQGHA